MAWPTIAKPQDKTKTASNLIEYEETCAAFSWDEVRSQLTGGGADTSINIADIAIDAQVRRGLGDKTALRWLAKDGRHHDYTYEELSRQSSQFASALEGLGVQRGGGR